VYLITSVDGDSISKSGAMNGWQLI